MSKESADEDSRHKIKELHNVAAKMESVHSEEEIFEIIMESSRQILDFYACSIDILKGDKFEVKAMRGGVQEKGTTYPIEGIAGKTVKECESYLVHDISEDTDAAPKSDTYRSAISIPIGDIGVFQALSEEKGHFDERDIELSEILMNHASEAIKRLRFENELQERNETVKRLHDTAIKMGDCTNEEEIYELTAAAAKNVLDFSVCSILMKHEDNGLEVKVSLSEDLNKGDILPLRDSIYTKTFMEKKSYLVNNIDEFKGAKPSSPSFKSVISIPIGDMGVFQAISDQVNNFNKDELELSELLISHLSETIKRLRNKKAVQESEKRYRGIFDNTGTAKALLDDELNIELVNKEFEKISGYEKAELEGHLKFRDFLFQDDLNKLISFMEESQNQRNNISEKYELRFIDKSGNIKETIGAISNVPGTRKFNLSIMDITEFKYAMEELKKSEKKYQTIFEKSGTAMLKIRKDTIIDMVNSKFVELFGYGKKEVEGKKSWTEIVVEKYLPKMEKYHQQRRENPNSAPVSYECEVIDKSGNSRKVILNVSMIPETDKSLVSIIDISDRKGFFEFGAMLDTLDIGMFILDSDGTITKANRRVLEILDSSEESLVGNDYKETILSNCKDVINQLNSNESKFNVIDKELIDKNGNKFKAKISSSKLMDISNNETYILCQLYPLVES